MKNFMRPVRGKQKLLHVSASFLWANRSKDKQRKAKRSRERQGEAKRSKEKQREAKGSKEKQREAKRSKKKQREAKRGKEKQREKQREAKRSTYIRTQSSVFFSSALSVPSATPDNGKSANA